MHRPPLALLLLLTILPMAKAWDPTAFSRPFLSPAPHLHALQDRPYFFPANFDPASPTVFLRLRRWDFIFTGNRRNLPGQSLDQENVNHLIPGDFNHLLVYIGKDARGLAYALEVNTSSFHESGGLQLLCLGSDFALLRHPNDKGIHDRDRLDRRWARRLRKPHRTALLQAEAQLLDRLATDLLLGFPYQFEYSHSGNLLDPAIHLIDDGFTDGSGCSDYWTTLFEEFANVCFPGSRISAAELETYFTEDPQGRRAYAPKDISPFANDLPIRQLLELGFYAVDDEPHRYPCDGSTEAGLVLPSLLITHPHMQEVQAFGPGIPLPHHTLQP